MGGNDEHRHENVPLLLKGVTHSRETHARGNILPRHDACVYDDAFPPPNQGVVGISLYSFLIFSSSDSVSGILDIPNA